MFKAILLSVTALASLSAVAGTPNGFRIAIKCTEVAPTSDHRPYRYNARVYVGGPRQILLSVHKVSNKTNRGGGLVEDLVTSQVVSTNPETTEFWNKDSSLILKDVRPYHSNVSILDYKALPKSYYMKCFHVQTEE